MGVNDATLRYWEKEFKDLKPRTSPGGTRSYTMENIEYIKLIRHLLKDRKLKIEGARQLLRDNREGVVRTQNAIERLESLRAELLLWREELEDAGL